MNMGAEQKKVYGPTVVLSTRASAFSPEQLRRAAFEKYKHLSPWTLMPALKGRFNVSDYYNPIRLGITGFNDEYNWLDRQVTSILKLDYGVTTNKIVCAILNARKELMQMESVKAAEVMLFEITATALVEKREPGEERKKPSTLFIINFRIISKKQVNENSAYQRRENGYSAQARLTVSTSKETDIDAVRITNFSNRIGLIALASLHEQNPAEKPKGHYGEQMRAQVEALAHELGETNKKLLEKKGTIEKLRDQVAILEEKIKTKDGIIVVLKNVIGSLRTIIENALRTLRGAGLGNRAKSIEQATKELEQEKHYK